MEGKFRELVVISGKGGTGKTSVAASLAVLARGAVVADCDVDAADLHLVLQPHDTQVHDFSCGHLARIRTGDCAGCGRCREVCRFGAVSLEPHDGKFKIDPLSCEGCGACRLACPVGAIDFPARDCGRWMVSQTRCGTMVHAKLAAGAENSGKLVSLVRGQARMLAQQEGRELVIVDGPPGIGCPVISSITGASRVLVVTEPTVSGEHDLDRVLALAGHFGIPAWVCVNKHDINPDLAGRIEGRARQAGARVAGRIRYDGGFTQAQIQGRAVVETDAPSAGDIRAVWEQINDDLWGATQKG